MILDGKKIAQQIKNELKERVKVLEEKYKTPKLVVIQVGEDPASGVYIKGKQRAAEEVGIEFEHLKLPETISTMELKGIVAMMSGDHATDGLIVQLPLPPHINEEEILLWTNVEADADGMHPFNAGKVMMGMDAPQSCTPKGIIKLLKAYNIELEGKHAVVIGRSNIVGKPMAQLLLNENCTVTTCHSKTKNLASHTRVADIVVAAVGIPEFITDEHISRGTIVIDVGIHAREVETDSEGNELTEEWRAVPEYEGLYEVSNFGKVRSLDREVSNRWSQSGIGAPQTRKGQLNALTTTSAGYIKTTLFKDGERKTVLVHRLVAEAFIPRTEGMPHVNHIDEDRSNNRFDNLEWTNYQSNNTYGSRMANYSNPVNQLDLEGNFIKTFPSAAEAARSIGKTKSSLYDCLKRDVSKCGGYLWEYCEDYEPVKTQTRFTKRRLCGDVLFDKVNPLAQYISPVPGGAGPLTVAMLIENTVEIAESKMRSE